MKTTRPVEWVVVAILAAIALIFLLDIRFDPSPACYRNQYGYVQYCDPNLTVGGS